MSAMQPSSEQYLRGAAQAHSAILAMIVRTLCVTSAVSSDQVEQRLRDIIGMFARSISEVEGPDSAMKVVDDMLRNVTRPLP